jgi:hypothetical protein
VQDDLVIKHRELARRRDAGLMTEEEFLAAESALLRAADEALASGPVRDGAPEPALGAEAETDPATEGGADPAS